MYVEKQITQIAHESDMETRKSLGGFCTRWSDSFETAYDARSLELRDAKV